MKGAWIISAGLMVVVLLVGIAVGEEDTVRRRPFPSKWKKYGYIYNADCRDPNQQIVGCLSETGWQRCRYPERLPAGHSITLPICPLSKQAIQTTSTENPIPVIRRDKRGFGKKLRRRLRKFGKSIERVGKKIKINYSTQNGLNAEATG